MRVKQLFPLVAPLILTVSHDVSAQAYYDQPLPIPCTGPSCVNPVATSTSSLQFQDTSVIRSSDGTYFRYSKGNDTGLGLNVVTAPALGGPWTYAYSVLSGPLKSSCGSADGQASSWRWAPEIHFVNNLYGTHTFRWKFMWDSADCTYSYYLFYTVEFPDEGDTCFDQCVATSSTMDEDSWEDKGSMNIPIPSALPATDGEVRVPYVRLDGNLLATTDDPQGSSGTPYMVFGMITPIEVYFLR